MRMSQSPPYFIDFPATLLTIILAFPNVFDTQNERDSLKSSNFATFLWLFSLFCEEFCNFVALI